MHSLQTARSDEHVALILLALLALLLANKRSELMLSLLRRHALTDVHIFATCKLEGRNSLEAENVYEKLNMFVRIFYSVGLKAWRIRNDAAGAADRQGVEAASDILMASELFSVRAEPQQQVPQPTQPCPSCSVCSFC